MECLSRLKDHVKCFHFVALLIFLHILPKASALKCYQCVEQPKSNETHLSCFYFDESHKFHAECSHSTYCMKKTSHYQLHNGSFIKISVHKCADQSQKTMVQDKHGDWGWANLVQGDIYQRGCYQHGISSMLSTEAVNCFCETDLCNSSPAPNYSSKLLKAFASASLILISTRYSLFHSPHI